jgi:dTDP-4-amino-4,6-dideoxygalactose transaminase
MTDMQAAIGRVQLRKLPQWLSLRRRNAAVLTDGFSRIPGLRLTIPPQEIEHAYYKYYVFVEPEALKRGDSSRLFPFRQLLPSPPPKRYRPL